MSKTPDGIAIELLDLETAAQELSGEFWDRPGYTNCYEEEDDISFRYVLRSILKKYPGISISGSINVNHGYGEVTKEKYKTANGKLSVRCQYE